MRMPIHSGREATDGGAGESDERRRRPATRIRSDEAGTLTIRLEARRVPTSVETLAKVKRAAVGPHHHVSGHRLNSLLSTLTEYPSEHPFEHEYLETPSDRLSLAQGRLVPIRLLAPIDAKDAHGQPVACAGRHMGTANLRLKVRS